MTTPTHPRFTGADCYWPRVILHLDLRPWLASLAPCNPAIGAAESARIRQALADLAADIETLGAGEMFIDVTHGQRHGTPEQMAMHVQARVTAATGGWSCVIGVGSTRLNARYASTVVTPTGLSIITPWEARERLRHAAVQRVFSTGPRVAAFLARHGVSTCGEVAALPAELPARRLGMVGRQLWLACQGRDTAATVRDLAPPKTVSQSKVLPPRTTSARTLETYLRHMCDRVSSRLRRLDMRAARLHVELRYAAPAAGIDAVVSLGDIPPDGRRWFEVARPVLRDRGRGEPVLELRVTAAHLENRSGQLELFTPDEVSALRPVPPDDPAGRPNDESLMGT